VPTSALPGVPVSAPVTGSSDNQPGKTLEVNVSESPSSSSLAVGVKLYNSPWFTVVAGVPEITGASFTFTTVMAKAGKLASAPASSVTVITIESVSPTSALPGVPEITPVAGLIDNQLGKSSAVDVEVGTASRTRAVG